MMRLLVAGTIHKAPTSRTTKNGDPMTFATVRVDTVEPTAWVTVTTFKQNAETLAKLKEGEGVSFSGKVDFSLYEAEGKKPRPNICVTADQITTLKQRRSASIPEHHQHKEKPVERHQNEADAKKVVANMVRTQATTKHATATGNCLQCGQELVEGLCISCPF